MRPIRDRFIKFLPESVQRFDAWADRNFGRFLGPESAPPPVRGLNLADGLVILLFAALSLLYQLDRLGNGFPTVIVAGDTGNIAGFAAATRYPELFAGDELLGNRETYRIYSTVHIPLVIGLEGLLGNFGLAFSLLLGVHTFLHYFGYYWLGRFLFKSRPWGLIFSLVSGGFIDVALQDGWGLFPDAYPRFTFQALLPFLMLLVFQWQDRPRRWVWIMVISGLMAFVHSVSAPAWAAAFWLGFIPVLPADWPWRRKVLQLAGLAGALLLSLLPFTLVYLSSRGSGVAPDYDLAYRAIDTYFGQGALHISMVVRSLYEAVTHLGLLWLSLAGLLIVLGLFRNERTRAVQLLLWAAGIVLVCILIPGVEQAVERHFRIIPLQTELPRGVRYLIPIMLLFCIYPLSGLTRRLRNRNGVYAVGLIGALFALAWLHFQPAYPISALPRVAACLAQRRLVCPRQQEYAQALAAVREQTPLNAKFMTFWQSARIEKGIEVRYLGLRPLVFAYKDVGLLAIANSNALARWNELEAERHKIVNIASVETQRSRIIKLARDAGADYLLTDYQYPVEEQSQLGIRLIYANATHFIFKLHP